MSDGFVFIFLYNISYNSYNNYNISRMRSKCLDFTSRPVALHVNVVETSLSFSRCRCSSSRVAKPEQTWTKYTNGLTGRVDNRRSSLYEVATWFPNDMWNITSKLAFAVHVMITARNRRLRRTFGLRYFVICISMCVPTSDDVPIPASTKFLQFTQLWFSFEF